MLKFATTSCVTDKYKSPKYRFYLRNAGPVKIEKNIGNISFEAWCEHSSLFEKQIILKVLKSICCVRVTGLQKYYFQIHFPLIKSLDQILITFQKQELLTIFYKNKKNFSLLHEKYNKFFSSLFDFVENVNIEYHYSSVNIIFSIWQVTR